MNTFSAYAASRLLEPAEICLFGDVAFDFTADEIRAHLKTLGTFRPLRVVIQSNGGGLGQGEAIADMLRRHRGFVLTQAHFASSVALSIMLAGDWRVIAENGHVGIHRAFLNPNGCKTMLEARAIEYGIDTQTGQDRAPRPAGGGISRRHSRPR
jgi:ATP-dependent protease ClpP protease subunit